MFVRTGLALDPEPPPSEHPIETGWEVAWSAVESLL
jgi:hypothetical protein